MEKEKLMSLVTKAQSGDSEAKNTLFTEFYDIVYDFAYKTVKDENLACDITQETFLEILRTIGNLQAPEAFVSWAKKITYHQCTRYFKKKKDVLVDEYEDGGDIFDSVEDTDTEAIPEEFLEKEDFCKTIKGMIDNLSEEQRSAVTLFYFDEMTIAKIAEIQAVSEGTVKSRLNYARKSLRKSVETYEQKHCVRLHSISLAPLFLLGLGSKSVMPLAKFTAMQQAIAASVASGAAAGATATATSATAGATASATASGTATAGSATAGATTAGSATAGAATTVTTGIVAKIVAGVIAIAVVSTGATALLGGFKKNEIPVPDYEYSQEQTYTEEETSVAQINLDDDPNLKNLSGKELVDYLLSRIVPESEYSIEESPWTWTDEEVINYSYKYELTSGKNLFCEPDNVVILKDGTEIHLSEHTREDLQSLGLTVKNPEDEYKIYNYGLCDIIEFVHKSGVELSIGSYDWDDEDFNILNCLYADYGNLESEKHADITLFGTINKSSTLWDVMQKLGSPTCVDATPYYIEVTFQFNGDYYAEFKYSLDGTEQLSIGIQTKRIDYI